MKSQGPYSLTVKDRGPLPHPPYWIQNKTKHTECTEVLRRKRERKREREEKQIHVKYVSPGPFSDGQIALSNPLNLGGTAKPRLSRT